MYGADAQRRPPRVNIVPATLIGAVALVAGIIGIVSAREDILAILVGAILVLWAMATARHAVTRCPRWTDHPSLDRIGDVSALGATPVPKR